MLDIYYNDQQSTFKYPPKTNTKIKAFDKASHQYAHPYREES